MLIITSSACAHAPQFDALVPKLLALEASGEAARMRAYMRRIVPLIAFDAHSKLDGQLHRPDAASAAIYELAARLGKPLQAPRR